MPRQRIKRDEPLPEKTTKQQDTQKKISPDAKQVQRALQSQELTPDAVRTIQAMHGNQFVSRMMEERNIQLGRDKTKKTTGETSTSSDIVVTLPTDVIEDIKANTLMAIDEQYTFQAKLASACGIPSKSHQSHGSNFSKNQTAQQVVNNFLDGISNTLPSSKYSSVVSQFTAQTGVAF